MQIGQTSHCPTPSPISCANSCMIKLSEALSIMKRTTANGKLMPFEIVFVKANRALDTGGEFVAIDRCYISDKKRSGTMSNRTINIRPLGTKDFIKVHLDLILYINGEAIA
jgi:hypothetical protein